jgi:hypothetical protein
MWEHTKSTDDPTIGLLGVATAQNADRLPVCGGNRSGIGKHQVVENAPETDARTLDEVGFIVSRDSFYMATVSETGWPYIQHRGGPPGFVKVPGSNLI